MKKPARNLNTKGFTLIELLVVIAIIGLLSSVITASVNVARAKARDAKRLSDLQQVQIALETYYADHGSYPATTGSYPTTSGYSYDMHCSSGSVTWGIGGLSNTGSGGWVPNLAPTYIPVLPNDPSDTSGSPATQCYQYNSNGTDYSLLAYYTLESYTSSNNPKQRPAFETANICNLTTPNGYASNFDFYSAGAMCW